MSYNPDYDPTGLEGGVDTNTLPWIAVRQVEGLSFKPLRASKETGLFSVLLRIEKGTTLPEAVGMGGLDLLVLSGKLVYTQDSKTSILRPGSWGFMPANKPIAPLVAEEATELLCTCYGPVSFMDGESPIYLLTNQEILSGAKEHNVGTIPSTLSECISTEENRSDVARFEGTGTPLAIANRDASALVVASSDQLADNSEINHSCFIDTRSVPWVSPPGLEDLSLKMLRVSEETGVASMIVRHNGIAAPHTHIGGGDFLLLHGRIGYRAGPPEGYGPGVWIYEPAGARHDATQRVTDEDLIYTANIYGPVAFDSGRGTDITNLISWVEYKALADHAGYQLVPSS